MKRFADFAGDSLTGGAPFFNEDFHDVNADTLDAVARLAGAMAQLLSGSDKNAVVSGCEITGSDPYNIAAGIVVLDGELYRLPATAGVTGGTRYIYADTDVETTRTYDDASTKAVLVEKRAQVANSTSGGAEIVFNPGTAGSLKRLDETLKNDLIDTDQIINSSVTTNKINNLAVTSGKIAASAVIESKIGTGAVTTDKIGAAAVTTDKLDEYENPPVAGFTQIKTKIYTFSSWDMRSGGGSPSQISGSLPAGITVGDCLSIDCYLRGGFGTTSFANILQEGGGFVGVSTVVAQWTAESDVGGIYDNSDYSSASGYVILRYLE